MQRDDDEDSMIVEEINKRDAAQINRSRHRTSTNSGYTKCLCKAPALPIGFTSMQRSQVVCQKCGRHFA